MNINTFSGDKFRCYKCKNHLSCFPVYLVADEGHICGRCPLPQDRPYFRNELYESLALDFKFPCRYTNCNQVLPPKDVLLHEEKCFFKTVPCPGSDFANCPVQGCRTTMLSHCRLCHQDLFLDDSAFNLDLDESVHFTQFMEFDEILFVVEVTYTAPGRVFTCTLRCVDEVVAIENYNYRVVFTRSYLNITGQGRTGSPTTVEECVVELTSFKTSPVRVSILFEQSLNHSLLSTLTCVSCGEYVLPPVLQYQDRTKCEDCSTGDKSRECVTNVSLDRIAEQLHYPCRYRKIGCKVVLRPEGMRKHRLICPFETTLCPLRDYVDCDWLSTRREVQTHVGHAHRDLMVSNGAEIGVKRDLVWKFYVVRFGDFLFRLKFYKYHASQGGGAVYKWVVHKLGHVEEAFDYEIEFGGSGRGDRVLMRRACLPFSEGGVFSDYKEDPCLYEGDEMWGEAEEIRFKIRIFQH